MRFFLLSCIFLFTPPCFSLDDREPQSFSSPRHPLLSLPSPADETEIAQQNEEEIQRVDAILNTAPAVEEWNDYVSEGIHTPP
jgi:hypothetical protein